MRGTICSLIGIVLILFGMTLGVKLTLIGMSYEIKKNAHLYSHLGTFFIRLNELVRVSIRILCTGRMLLPMYQNNRPMKAPKPPAYESPKTRLLGARLNPTIFNIICWITGSIDSSTINHERLMVQVLF